MKDLMIPNIAQLKQAEISALTSAVGQLQHDVQSREAVITALQARSDHFGERLKLADALRTNAQAVLAEAQTAENAAQAMKTACATAAGQAETVEKMLTNIAEKKIELVRQVVYIAAMLEKTGQMANKLKAANPQVPDSVIDMLNQANSDCANVVALALTAQNSCILAEADMVPTRKSLSLAQQLSQDLVGLMTDEGGVLAALEAIDKADSLSYDSARTANSNAGSQLNHATAQLSAGKARLASLTAGLAAASAPAAKKA